LKKNYSFFGIEFWNSWNLQSLIEDLDSKNWVKVCESLNDVRRFALFNSSLLLPIL
jgi:hypothetical protein